MGRLLYGPHQRPVEIEDRALAHLKIVVLSKLRRGESFAYSWDIAPEEGSGRATLWISPAIPIEFLFHGSRPPALNRRWIQEMSNAAANGELHLLPEPPDAHDGQGGSQGRW